MTNIHYTRIGNLGMELKFLNGTIIVPDEYGAYVIASGCGSGKTTAIKQIIRENYQSGILYSAFTIEECNEMYQYCKRLVEVLDDPDSLSLDDIIVLHSDYKSEGTDNNLWRNNPTELYNKKILICTHYKLMNEVPGLLMNTNFRYEYDEYYDLISEVRYGRNGEGVKRFLPRRFLLIDEVPGVSTARIKITKADLSQLSIRRILRRDESTGVELASPTVKYEKPGTFKDMRIVYESEALVNPRIRTYTDSPLDNFRKDMELSLIYRNYSRYWSQLRDPGVNAKDDPRPSEIYDSYSISSLAGPDMKNSILLFEGTGDLTFYGSSCFNVLTFPHRKYDSGIKMHKFPFKLKRYNSVTELDDLMGSINKAVEEVSRIINENQKTLIVTWKNLKNSDKAPEEDPEDSLEVKSNKLNERISLTKLYDTKLRSVLPIDKHDSYKIIHYQSGLDRATNQFMEFDSVIFLGEFHVPDYVVDRFNREFCCGTTYEFYLMYQLVQAICRTRIRKHSGEKVNVYFSEDWNDKIIHAVRLYLTNESTPMIGSNSSVVMNNTAITDSSLSFIRPKWRKDIEKLCSIIPDLRTNLANRRFTTYEIPLDKLYDVLPKDKKETGKYNSLVNYLKKFNTVLIIRSEREYLRK